jgi:hypothetical protein
MLVTRKFMFLQGNSLASQATSQTDARRVQWIEPTVGAWLILFFRNSTYVRGYLTCDKTLPVLYCEVDRTTNSRYIPA